MEKLKFSVEIDAPKEKVWDTMLEKETYTEWTSAFAVGSTYQGDWKKGSKITFLGPTTDGHAEGMVSRIKENRQYEYISIEHLGFIKDGVEDTESEAVKAWAGAHENYTFEDKNGKTIVKIDIDTNEDFKEMFEGIWPVALQKLKEISENTNVKSNA